MLLRTSPTCTRREQGRSRPGCFPAIALLLLVTPAAFAHGSISLRSSARVPASGDVTLSDVAELTGPEAVSLAPTVVLKGSEFGAGTRRSLGVDQLRGILDDAKADWSRLSLSGASCELSRAPTAAPAALKSGERPAPAAPQGPTVRSLIPDRIARVLGVTAQDLRLSYDESDAAILDLPITDHVVEISPSGAADRLPLRVEVYQAAAGRGFTLVTSGLVRVGVQVLREVGVARTSKSRGDALAAEDVLFERRWTTPSQQTPTRDELLGALARTKIQPGQVLDAADVEAPYFVKKGQIVSVRSVTNTVVLKSTARALENGRLGQTIKLQPLDARGKKDSRSFTARVEGAGRTVTSPPGAEPAASENKAERAAAQALR